MPIAISFSQGNRTNVGLGFNQPTRPNIGLAFSVFGPSGGDDLIQVLAAEDLPAYTLVTAQGNIADSNNFAHYDKVVGMTIIAVLTGFIARLADDDEVTNPGWAWSPGSHLFLNGTTISVTPPSTGFSQRVAVARTATTIIMGLGPPILL